MSAAFFIVLDKQDPDFDTEVSGKLLSQDAARLKKVAKSLDIRALEDFVSYSPEDALSTMEDMDVDPDEIEGIELPEQKWHDAQEGLEWVGMVSEHLQAHPSAVKNAKGVLDELAEFGTVFEHAKAVGARWNLQVDF